jgi:hypothetical protein
MTPTTSWRDETPQAVQDDLDGLAAVALDAARALLEKNGEFFPFGVTLSDDGEQKLVAGDPGLGEHPESEEVLDTLRSGMLGDRDDLRAAAFVADVLADGSDAISVQVEHRDGGPAIQILQQFAKEGAGIDYGAVSGAGGDRRIWPTG